MNEKAILAWLAEAGWYTGMEFDLCWLDCPQDGYLLIDAGRCICLCSEHAFVLQSGCWDGDYRGAPLPPASRATAWPWQFVTAALASASAA